MIQLLMWILLGLSSHSLAQQALIFDDEITASQMRLDLIRQEQKSIYISFYIIKEEIGLAHWALLRDAAKRGVDVKVLIDAQGSESNRALLSHLTQSGIKVKVFNPFFRGARGFSPKHMNRRLHDKLFIFGDDLLIVGDRNIGNDYFELPTDLVFVSRELILHDSFETKRAQLYFEQLWEDKSSSNFKFLKREKSKKVQKIANDLDRVFELLQSNRFSDFRRSKFSRADWNTLTDWREKLIPIRDARFVHDQVGKKGKVEGMEASLLEMINQSKHQIIIQNPYVVLTKKFKLALETARARGVKITLITNGMHNNDVRLAQKALYADLNWFIANEIDIWEYSPEHTLHMKNLLVDDHLGYVGSFNLDPRSERLSHEVGVVFESKALADQLREQLIADQAQCSALILNGELKKDIKLSWFFRYLILPLLRNQL